MCCQPGWLEILLGLSISSNHNRRWKEKSWLFLNHRITFFFRLFVLFWSSWHLEIAEESHCHSDKNRDTCLSLLLDCTSLWMSLCLKREPWQRGWCLQVHSVPPHLTSHLGLFWCVTVEKFLYGYRIFLLVCALGCRFVLFCSVLCVGDLLVGFVGWVLWVFLRFFFFGWPLWINRGDIRG